MSWYILSKAGERDRATQPSPPGEGDERPDAERVLDGHPGFAVAAGPVEELPGVPFRIEEDEIVEDPDAAGRIALALLDAGQDEAEEGTARLRRALALNLRWYEAQRYKADAAAGTVPPAGIDRNQRYPRLMSLVAELNAAGMGPVGLPAVAQAVIDNLWPKVARFALIEARAHVAALKIAAAATAAEKIAAAEAVNWNNGQS